VRTALRFSIRISNRRKGVRLASVADHKKIADAIIAGKPQVASNAMRVLIQEVLDLIGKESGREEKDAR
jgi:DNA-binding FadR family transcriptional regulator